MLHTRIFLQKDYGIYINLYAWVGFLIVVYLFGMETTYFNYATKEGANEQKVFRITQTFVLAISFIISVTIALFAGPLAQYFNVPNHPEFIVWLAIILFIDASVSIPFARLRLQKKAALFATAKIINVALQIGLNIYFLLIIYNPEFGIGYMLLANLIANSFYLLFFLKTLVSWRPTFDKQVFSTMFSYAFPIMLTGLAGIANENFSRIMLISWLPENFYPGRDADYALGIFGAAYRFSVIMAVAVTAFRFAAEPFFFSHASNKNSPLLFAKVNHYFTLVCCFILLGVTINLDLLKYIIGSTFWEGLDVVPILMTGMIFFGVYYNISVWFKLNGKTYFGTIITVIGVVITVALNYFLIPLYGYMGSSWATLLCYFFMAMICYALGQKYFPVPYKLLSEFGYLILTWSLILISGYVTISNQVLATSFHALVILFFLAVVFMFEKNYWRSSVD